jgi:hypothetical protein
MECVIIQAIHHANKKPVRVPEDWGIADNHTMQSIVLNIIYLYNIFLLYV